MAKQSRSPDTAEHRRLKENLSPPHPWYHWGPYLSERQWGTVREDYSSDGTAWDYFPHDQARSRAYRWGEDGLLGFCDEHQLICFGLALWNGKDPILKERLFGLTNSEGNHGEDVKECYFYLDGTPTHSYCKSLYKYPQSEFPYRELVEVNGSRGKDTREYELVDTGVFDERRYFDIVAEYAKASPDDLFIRITATNQGPEPAELTILPQLWMRNRWSWTTAAKEGQLKSQGSGVIRVEERSLGTYTFTAADPAESLFTENETNSERLFASPNRTPFVKDAFHRAIVEGQSDAVNPAHSGTKAAFVYRLSLEPGASKTLRLRLAKGVEKVTAEECDRIFAQRIEEADEFYKWVTPELPEEVANIQRQAFAGLLWSKQYYHYDVRMWLHGDPLQPPSDKQRLQGRNHGWEHFAASEVLSMPDKWEYPWFAAWDLAFHCIAFALIDPDFAKNQLLLLLREWYMHPNGQIPAYEWAFGDVNPPVHAWTAWRVYSIEKRQTGQGDRPFLEKIFQKLLLNFTWWVNRKDPEGNNVFEGGFLGLDNIGVFDRNQPMPNGEMVEQSDGTSWMAMFSLGMLTIALELAKENPVYEDVASKFLEHFVYIADAMNRVGEDSIELWDEADGFYYDVLHRTGEQNRYVKVRSMVGLIPLLAVTTLETDVLKSFPGFRQRLEWFKEYREEAAASVGELATVGSGDRLLLALVSRERLERILQRVFDETEFLSDYGLRAVSKAYAAQPYTLQLDGHSYQIDYEPGESTSGLFGGNSNWRGPIWFPVNYLLVEALQNHGYYYGDSLKIEVPTGSGRCVTLAVAAAELERRLLSLFRSIGDGRPCLKDAGPFKMPDWQDLLLFHEYFHGDTGRGLGASHQTGWTGLVAKIIQQMYFTAADVTETASVMIGSETRPSRRRTQK